jgi:predicted porin
LARRAAVLRQASNRRPWISFGSPKNKANQVGLTLAHDLSRHTFIYATLVRQWASGDSADVQATIIGAGGTSSNSTQTLARVGLTLCF